MSERDDLAEQAYHQLPVPEDPEEARLNRLAQRFYEASDLSLLGVDKPKVVEGLRAVLNQPEPLTQAATGLSHMLELQRNIERVWGRLVDPDDPAAVSKYIREVVLCATDELHEVLGEVHWKPWKTTRGIKDMPKYREEMSDVLHFILDLYLAAGLTGEDIVQDYVAKHHENLRRNSSTEYRDS